MKLHITYITIITAIALAALFFFDQWMKSKDHAKELNSIVTEKQDSIRYHKNKYNQVVADKKASEVTPKEFQDYYKQETDKLKQQLGITAKDLKAYMDAKFISQGSGKTVIIHNHSDSTGRRQDSTSLSVADGHLTFRAVSFDNTHYDYKYSYQDSMTFAISAKKKWVLGNEQLYGTGTFGNPNTKITNSTSVLIKDYRDKRWVISAGVSYNPFLNQFQPAVHVGYALIKF